MRKIFVFAALMLIATWSFAADFAPSVLTLTGESEITYDFDGSELTVPVNITGTPAAVYFVLNTHGLAASIGATQNGFLGWHYVNGVDTTVYVSQRYQRDVGTSSIVWNGVDADGNDVSPGTYDYYLWAYDDQTARLPLCDYMMIGYDWESQFNQIYTKGSDGLTLAKPLICGSQVWWWAVDTTPYMQHGAHLKWEVGGDPSDLEHLQTTWCAMYQDKAYASTFTYGGPVFFNDFNNFIHCSVNVTNTTNTFLKFEWVTDGEAILDEGWLGWDELELEDHGNKIGVWSQKPSCYTDGSYIYAVSPGLHQKEEEWNKLRCVSFDGELVFDKMMHEWYMPDDNGPNEYINGAFHHMHSDPTRANYWLLGSHTSCMHEMIDTTMILDDADTDAADYIVWKNANGDYFFDMAYQPDFEPAWVCLHDEESKVTRRDSFSVEKNGINFISISYLGLTSFGVSTQDGTAIDLCSYSDDTVSDNKNIKGGGLVCSGGTSFDGLYSGAPLSSGTGGWAEVSQIWYTASDSFKGSITNEPSAVEEEAVAAFAVDQNTPNPFNPTTTIGFTITEAGHVSVDIYNVAGQKVDTLVNDALSAGRHSLVWNASGMSAGVYFYTVKSGDFSKTMKMTLLK